MQIFAYGGGTETGLGMAFAATCVLEGEGWNVEQDVMKSTVTYFDIALLLSMLCG